MLKIHLGSKKGELNPKAVEWIDNHTRDGGNVWDFIATFKKGIAGIDMSSELEDGYSAFFSLVRDSKGINRLHVDCMTIDIDEVDFD